MRNLFLLISVALALGLGGCGGGGGGGSTATTPPVIPPTTPPLTPTLANNQVAITVDHGLSGEPNTPNVSVTICVPGTTTCQVIPNILLDTGSFGLRLFASGITIPLQTSQVGGGTLTNCAQFGLGTAYGSVQLADIKLGGEVASNTPIQVIADPNFAAVPPACANGGTGTVSSAADLRSNGILGIGAEPVDCPACVASAAQATYFICTSSSSCNQTVAATALQVANPVAKFAQDNNGDLITLPTLTAGGAPSASGTLTFGIGTETNNALGSAKIYTTTAFSNSTQFYDTFTTVFNSTSDIAFMDSGSNGTFFADGSISSCTLSQGFYCPTSTLALTAVMQGVNGTNSAQDFSVANAQTLFDSGAFASNNIAGTTTPGVFDWGLPFFFGRTIYTALDGSTTPGGAGPYVAF
jgi:hypothetical protein